MFNINLIVTLKICYCFSYLREIKKYKAIINLDLKLLSDKNKWSNIIYVTSWAAGIYIGVRFYCI